MNLKVLLIFSLTLPAAGVSLAQKPFVEGTINYKVKITTADGREFKGVYTFTFKEGRIKKELRLNNGYDDIVLINCEKNTAYCLKIKNGKKYAIQSNMDEMLDRQKKYVGYTLKEENGEVKKIAGYSAQKGDITFPDQTHSIIYYNTDWYPDRSITFERYPDAHFLPLAFEFTNSKGITTSMEADKVSVSPVENAVFVVPGDYKIISNSEYKALSEQE